MLSLQQLTAVQIITFIRQKTVPYKTNILVPLNIEQHPTKL
jgi:hypothetical protein